MMSNQDEDKMQSYGEHPREIYIDRSCMDSGRTTHTKEPEDSDFSINGALVAFMRGKSSAYPDATPISDGAEDEEIPPPTPSDPHPWMRCCGRNFIHSVYSLQPSRAPKRGLGRHRRGRGQPTP